MPEIQPIRQRKAITHKTIANNFKSIYKVQFEKCDSYENVIQQLSYLIDRLPEGLEQAIFIPELMSVVSAVWKPSINSSLIQNILEIQDSGYFLVSDASLEGKDSLFLVYFTFNETNPYLPSWVSDTCSKIVSSYFSYNKGANKFLITLKALQLSTHYESMSCC